MLLPLGKLGEGCVGSLGIISFLVLKNNCIYLFLAVLGLHCPGGFSLPWLLLLWGVDSRALEL